MTSKLFILKSIVTDNAEQQMFILNFKATYLYINTPTVQSV